MAMLTRPSVTTITTTWLGVKLNTTGQVKISTTKAVRMLGIVQELSAAAGNAVLVAGVGEISKLKMATTCTAGDFVYINTSGKGAGTPAAGDCCIGQALQSAAANDIIDVLVEHRMTHA